MNCKRCNKPIEAHEAGRETDACIAQVVMGWKEVYAKWGEACGVPPDKAVCDDSFTTVKRYSIDGNAMLEVVEEMRRQGWHYDGGVDASEDTAPRERAYTRFKKMGRVATGYANAETLLLSASRAALAAKGGA